MKKLVFTAVAIAVLMSAAGSMVALRGQSSDELDALRTRVARLEAKEEVLSAFNQYLYGIDTGFKEDVTPARRQFDFVADDDRAAVQPSARMIPHRNQRDRWLRQCSGASNGNHTHT